MQTLASETYAAWKRDLVVKALHQAGMQAPVAPLVDAHGDGRRRATFHARFAAGDPMGAVGFMEARSHRIIDIDRCPILAPALEHAPAVARRLAEQLAAAGKPLDILIAATDAGLDVDLHGLGRADARQTASLVVAAQHLDLARLSNHGDILVERRPPTLRMGEAHLVLPPGAFLQATRRGEEILVGYVTAGVGTARKVADLFCGVGTFALRLAGAASVRAWDSDPKAIAALARAANSAPELRSVDAQTRDLFHRPLRAEELADFDALVFDPPRAGAAAQAVEIARSAVANVVAVSCDPGTFARDAATLVTGGYRLTEVIPVDQFRYSGHVEVVGLFQRPLPKPKRRRLLS